MLLTELAAVLRERAREHIWGNPKYVEVDPLTFIHIVIIKKATRKFSEKEGA